ncbi:phospho-sugar mutase [Compostibacter hankyongensis]|uniref:Phospho-sugar mutase n=1 Tax=Compostibacter hankyongensis TaxID=1007089 RepID=A0ABP8FRX6_9BACT
MEANIQEKAQQWLDGPFDEATKSEIRKLQKENPEALADAFYKNLEFGTGGLRGIMGAGTNRINKYTIGMATQGFANYLKKSVQGEIRIAIAHDSRNNSRSFAEITAQVMAANGIRVFLFESLRPTPELSFTIRHLRCHGGVVCTASHNPKEYNGYKAYWSDGGQLVPPHDKNVIDEVNRITSPEAVKWEGQADNITLIGQEVDDAYLDMVKALSVNPDIIKKQHDLKIVYTPIHGTGITLVPEILKRFGFTSLHIVEEQATPDGNFPTVVYPNPEEAEAMSLGLKKAEEIGADILLGTDPDADRVAVGVKNHKNKWILLNGNQTAVLLFNYLISARKQKGISSDKDYVCKTIVTTDLIDRFAKSHGIRCFNVLTGFKWIAEKIREHEDELNFVCGGEESYGYMIGDKTRDKDAISAVALICEMAAVARDRGQTLFDELISIYQREGMYLEKLLSITRKGRDGAAEIAAMMQQFRENPPRAVNGSPVTAIYDYQLQQAKNPKDGTTAPITGLPKSNVLQFLLADGSKISARPSGTEPKIKFYFSVQDALPDKSRYDELDEQLAGRIAAIIDDLKLQ